MNAIAVVGWLGYSVGAIVYVVLLLGTTIIYVITVNFSTVIDFTVVAAVIAVIVIVGVSIVGVIVI